MDIYRHYKLLNINITLPVLSVLFFISTFHLPARDIIMSGIPNQDQLPMGHVQTIFQDSEGYMWYGTDGGGLCRDDGYTVRVFRSDFRSPGLLKNNSITSITEDKINRIWFGTKRGINILDKKDYTITELEDEGLKEWLISKVTATSDGSVWVAANEGIFRYNSRQERTGTYFVDWYGYPKKSEFFFEDPETGILWMAQQKGGLFRFDDATGTFVSYNWPFSEWPTAMVRDSDNKCLWVSTAGKGIVRFDPYAKDPQKMFIVQHATVNGDNPLQGGILAMVQDDTNRFLWAITTDNLYAYSVSEDGLLAEEYISDIIGTEKKILTSLTCDRLGNIWVSGFSPHSFILSFAGRQLQRDNLAVLKDILGFPPSADILVYDDGCYWIWPKRGGLFPVQSRNKPHLLF